MKSEVHKRKVDTQDELLAYILDVATCMKKREDQLKMNDMQSSYMHCQAD
jgi:hypothetical protein